MIPLPDSVRLTHPAVDFPVLEIDHAVCRARIALHGAQVMEWQPAGQEPVLYCSPLTALREGKAIRGGIPICWPWFGPHPDRAELPAHGIVRSRFWALTAADEDADGVVLGFGICDDAASRALWDHGFHLVVEARLGRELHLTLTARNTGDAAISVSGALHSYLAIGDLDAVEIGGLEGAPFLETAGGVREAGVQAGPIRITKELDRIYTSDAPVTVRDRQRSIHVDKRGSASTVVWNPGPEKAARLGDLPAGGHRCFVCVEAANAPGAEVAIAAGATHSLATILTVEG